MYSEIAANKRKTWFILMFFVVFTAGMSWIVAMFMDEPMITPFVLVGALIYVLISYFSASKMSLAMNGAKPIEKRDNPRLYRIVENLAITEGIPTPKIYIMPEAGLNAFATGRNPQNSSVAATQGLLDALTDQELEGVMAHELGHIRNYDIRVSLIAFALVAIISLLADFIFRLTWFRDSDDDNALFFAIGIAAAILAPFAALLIQMAISRRREYLADATGALTTRYPEGLASALKKIQSHGSTMKKQNTSTAHFFFANPLKKGSFAGLFSTHPPVAERIKRLHEMGGKL